jgi:hypothetical protein
VEEDSEIITAVETAPGNTDDCNQLKPLLKQQKEGLNDVVKITSWRHYIGLVEANK